MILYFSGTGNSKYCAKKIAEKTNDKLVSINMMLKNNICELDMDGEDTLGIVCPTYDYNIPWVVKDFLEKLVIKDLKEHIYCFGVFTCGGNASGMCAKSLESILKDRGITLNYAATIPMPDNYILLYKLDTSENDQKIENANKLLEDISMQIMNKDTCKIKAKGRLFSVFSKLIINSQKDTRSFKVSDECINCGLCEKVCSLNIINIKDGKPVWSDKECCCCLSCINRCPKKAISKGKMSIKNEHYYNKLIDADIE